ncbi:MAG TPA: alkaline phosphatase family protein [Solirubrobacteraceae bacterium]|nr:alkaline phosphatase family protein [Solirubrobacteraceae bacterium]
MSTARGRGRGGKRGSIRKLVLVVIDGLRSESLERAVEEGRTPALAHLMEHGVYVDDCVSAFPSVTPVCTSAIATGVGPDRHGIPAMNWFHRGEARYVEYGSSLPATRAFGIQRSLTDTIYNLNLAHLSRRTPTVFESLDDAGLRTAGTTFMVYRGRHRHPISTESALARLVGATLFRHAVYGPQELFYADLFSSRPTGCRSQLGLPGARDAHAGCVGAYLVEHDLFDFLLLSLPDNDAWSHRRGPEAQLTSVELADRQLQRVMEAAGGFDEFLADHAVIVLADHAQSQVDSPIELEELVGGWRVLQPDDPAPEEGEVALCPGQRAAMVYALDPELREGVVYDVVEAGLESDAVDLALWLEDGEAIIAGDPGRLRFSPGGELADLRGERWSVAGELDVVAARVQDGVLVSDDYPDPLGRAWSALQCAHSGDVLLSAAPGHEFTDWGGAGHLGAGSHGSLHRDDSLCPLLWCGAGPASSEDRAQWSVRDVEPMVRAHFRL